MQTFLKELDKDFICYFIAVFFGGLVMNYVHRKSDRSR